MSAEPALRLVNPSDVQTGQRQYTDREIYEAITFLSNLLDDAIAVRAHPAKFSAKLQEAEPYLQTAIIGAVQRLSGMSVYWYKRLSQLGKAAIAIANAATYADPGDERHTIADATMEASKALKALDAFDRINPDQTELPL